LLYILIVCVLFLFLFLLFHRNSYSVAAAGRGGNKSPRPDTSWPASVPVKDGTRLNRASLQ
jgi:hypothetical protein